MLHIRKIDPLSEILDKRYVTFVGGGGKTSFIEYLAGRAVMMKKRVAITTTTKIYAKDPYVLTGQEGWYGPDLRDAPLCRVGSAIENGKLTSVSFSDIEGLGRTFDLVLIEGDGARGKPLKYPAVYEPVIPPFSEAVFVIAGLDGLYGTVRERVFRWELFCEHTGVDPDAVIDQDLLLRFFSEEAMLKSVPKGIGTVVLNKLDSITAKSAARAFARLLLDRIAGEKLILSSITREIFFAVQKT